MPLPPAFRAITVTELYPDRITINFRYRVGAFVGLQTYDEAMRNAGARTYGRDRHRADLPSPTSGHRYSAHITRHLPNAAVNVFVDINPLRHLNRQTATTNANRNMSREQDNWVPANQVSMDNRHIWQLANHLIEDAALASSAFLSAALRDEDGTPRAGPLQEAVISLVEVTIDFADPNPLRSQEFLRFAFRRHLRSERTAIFARSAFQYTSLDRDVTVRSAYRRQDQKFKTYIKGEQRTRLECEYKRQALVSAHISRQLNLRTFDFAERFHEIAEHALEDFNAILGDLEAERPRGPGAAVFDLIACVLRRTRDSTVARRLLHDLAANERVATSQYPSSLIYNLIHDGLLARPIRDAARF